MPSPAEPGTGQGAVHGINPGLLRLLRAEPLGGLTVVDVGTGRGALALLLAPRCRRVIGVDRDAVAIEAARSRARDAAIANAEFVVADAEATSYERWAPDLVAAHLCMSDAVIERAARALAPGRVLAFVAFHADQWVETGRRSRFAYGEETARAALDRSGFAVETLEVDREVRRFESVQEALEAVSGHEGRWREDGRWEGYCRYLETGGRSLTQSHLVVKARRR